MQFLFILLLILNLGTASSFAQTEELFTHSQDKEKYKKILVERVFNGGTIKLEGGEKIKLIGLRALEAPPRSQIEYDRDGKPMERKVLPENTLKEKAFAFAVHLLEGKYVRIEFDEQKTNDNLETLAYVFIIDTNTFVNAEILRQGYADLQIRPPNVKYENELRAAYREAREEKRGLQGL